jgi:hypothetical protein
MFAQGFGMVKMTAKLERKRPPEVYLMRTAIQVVAESQSAMGGALKQQFETMLANELCRNDPRLRVENNSPEIILHTTITSLETRENWQQKQSSELKKVGTKQVWNDKKKQSETKDDFQFVPVTKNYKVVEGAISLSLRVTEKSSATVLYSGAVSDKYRKEFLNGNGAPLQEQLPVALMGQVIEKILPAVVPTRETVEVQMAKGKLEDASKLGQTGLWTRMLESLESMQPLKKTQDDAYRFYNMGVACEALSYQSETPGVAQQLLEQAAAHYGKAIDLKPDEKYFREPQLRIQTALTQLGKGESQKALYARSPQSTSKAIDTGQGITERNSKSVDAFTNQQVVELTKSGLEENILIEMIREAEKVNFDLGPAATMTLLQNKVTNKVIGAMRARGVK